MTGIPVRDVRPGDIPPCPGSGRPWDRPRPYLAMCPECDAGPVALHAPDDSPAVIEHPDMVVWAGLVDVVLWRQLRALRDQP